VVLVGARRDQAREVARQMAPGVQADAQRDRHRDDLQNTNKRKKNQQQLRKIMQMQTGRWVGAQEILSAKLVTSQAHRHYDCHCTSGPAKALRTGASPSGHAWPHLAAETQSTVALTTTRPRPHAAEARLPAQRDGDGSRFLATDGDRLTDRAHPCPGVGPHRSCRCSSSLFSVFYLVERDAVVERDEEAGPRGP
jgi:hypothetical protein